MVSSPGGATLIPLHEQECLLANTNVHWQWSVHTLALRCLGSWVQFGVPVMDIDPMVGSIFSAIHNDVFFDTAVDTLINILSHPDHIKYVR